MPKTGAKPTVARYVRTTEEAHREFKAKCKRERRKMAYILEALIWAYVSDEIKVRLEVEQRRDP